MIHFLLLGMKTGFWIIYRFDVLRPNQVTKVVAIYG